MNDLNPVPATPGPAPAPEPRSRRDERRLERHARRAARHGWERAPRRRLAHALSWGGALIVIGAAWLVQGDGWWVPPALWRVVLPALFGWSGLVTMLVDRSAWGVVDGLKRVAIGAWLYVVFNDVWGLTFMQTWPVVLVVIGLATVARGLLDREENAGLPTTDRARDEESAQ